VDHATVEAFAKLYRGFEKKHGEYREDPPVEGKAKLGGRASTVDGDATIADFTRHLAGNMPSIGAVPLRMDDTAVFGAIDVDDYDLDLEALAQKIKDLPLFLTRSKSSGAHLWLFVEQGIPAKDMIAALQNYAGLLGFAKDIEIFPKQSTRGGPEDIGNWINLPYFGNTRTALVYDSKQDKCVELSLEQFVELASKYNKATAEEILSHSRMAESRAKRDSNAPLFSDGPPCNVSAMRKFAAGELDLEGSRSHFLFNLAVYLSRRFETKEEVGSILNSIDNGTFVLEYVTRKGQDNKLIKIPAVGLGAKEIENTILKSVFKKDYNYKCRENPMCNLCQRALCKSRTFGVDRDKADDDLEFGALTKVLQDVPYYYLSVGDKRVKFKDVDELNNQQAFRNRILEASNYSMPPRSGPEFAAMIGRLVADGSRIDVLPLQDGNTISDILIELETYIKEYKTDRLEEVKRKRVFHDFENQIFVFQLIHFKGYLRRNKIEFSPQFLADELKKHVGMMTIDYAGQQIGSLQLDAQSVPMSMFSLDAPSERDVPSSTEDLEEKEMPL